MHKMYAHYITYLHENTCMYRADTFVRVAGGGVVMASDAFFEVLSVTEPYFNRALQI